MSLNLLKIVFLGLLIVVILIDNCTAGKHKDDDDEYDDDDEECYPGRNCKPGCYCSDSECRPYELHQHKKCHPYNYPQWKVWRKGSKKGNSTVTIVMAHHLSEKSDKVTNALTQNNFTTFEFQDLSSTLAKENLKNETTTTTSLLPTDLPSFTPEFLSKLKESESIRTTNS